VILAMGDGKRAAASVDAWLRGEYPPRVESEPTVQSPMPAARASAH